jgi:hypothetical protein
MTSTPTVFDAPTLIDESGRAGLPEPTRKLRVFEPSDELPCLVTTFDTERAGRERLQRHNPIAPCGYGCHSSTAAEEADDVAICLPFPEDVPDPLSAA